MCYFTQTPNLMPELNMDVHIAKACRMKFRRFFTAAVAALFLALPGCSGGPSPGPGLIADFTGTSPVEYYDLGFNRLLQGDDKGAEEAFMASLKMAGKNGLDFAPPHEGMARLFLKQGKLAEAEVQAETALELDSHWTRAYWVLGKVAEIQGREPLALAQYERALIYDPGDPEVTEAAVGLLKRLGRDKEAREVLERSEAIRAKRSDMPRGVSGGEGSPASGARDGAPASAGGSAAREGAPTSSGGSASTLREGSPASERARVLLEPFFPKTVGQLSPKVLAVFDQPRFTRGALAVVAVGDGEHVLARAFHRSVRPDEELSRPPLDAPGRPEERWIHRVLALGLMEMLPDGTFRPDEPVSRMTMALWIEETISRLRNQQQVFSLYRGQKSPFPDLPDGHYGLNAARIVTELGLIPPLSDGRFAPEQPLGMDEGVEAVRRLAPALMGE